MIVGSFAFAPAGQANVINYVWPICIVIFSIIILKEPFSYRTILAVVVSFTGAAIVFTGGDFTNFRNEYSFGYLLALIAVLYDFIFVPQHVVEPMSYAVCNDESEPTRGVRFFAAQIASTNPDICDRTLAAAAGPAEHEPAVPSGPGHWKDNNHT